MGMAGFIAIGIVMAAIVLIVRGRDVRLVLLMASLAIAGGSDLLAGQCAALAAIVREFVATFSNEKFVVPICTAMGFAYVLRHTGCERHLVLLLVKPLRSVRGLLVPGIIAVGFLVNIPVISQTSTAVCIGPVVVPLMRAAGYSLATIGACLLLGASLGGELLNPGAPELLTVFNKTGVSTQRQVSEYLPKPVFTQLAVATLVAWILSHWWERKTNVNPALLSETEPEAPGRINPIKAFVPFVPLVLLFLSGPPFDLFHVPQNWLVKHPSETALASVAGPSAAWIGERKLDPSYSSRLIGLAMMVGVLAAMIASPSRSRDCVKQFFEGAGYGFANIVSLIVTATCFGKAIETAGLAAALGRLIAEAPGLLQPLAALIPLAFAAVSGSGMASTQSLYGFFYEPALDHGHDPTAVGSMVALGAAAGRTMSPVAAVTLMCATLTGTNPFTLARRVAMPLLVGITVVIILRMSGVY
ncbi:MAG TPA: C4-dicarboxylate transporter DcuC [Urbifossiella sp.]